MRNMKFIINVVLAVSSIGALAQESARTVQYHSQDIVAIRAKVKYTTLIELPTTEKIMEAATGDKDFWIVDVVGNFCFVHPAKQGIASNLNLITDKGNIYSFTLQEISGSPSPGPDLKGIVEPADQSAIAALSGPPQFVPAAQLEQSRQQLAALQSHIEQAPDYFISRTWLCDVEAGKFKLNIYRLKSLSLIYRLGLDEILSFFGVDIRDAGAEQALVGLPHTYLVTPTLGGTPSTLVAPLDLREKIDFGSTNLVARMFESWGEVPVALLQHMDWRNSFY